MSRYATIIHDNYNGRILKNPIDNIGFVTVMKTK